MKPSNASQSNNIFDLFFLIVRIVLRFMTISLEVFLHRNFGERFFGPLEVVAGLVAISIMASTASLFYLRDGAAMFGFGLIVLALGAYHLWEIHQRKKDGARRIHSRYWGDSLPFFYTLGVSHQTIQFYIEPGICFVVGIILRLGFPMLGLWIMTGALAWFVMCQLEMRRWNNRILDAIDHEIEAKNFDAAVMERKAPSETEGFFVPVSPNFTHAQRASLKEAFEGLDPKLKELMDEGNEDERAKEENLSPEEPLKQDE